jgi:hypothetical protein
MLATGVVPAFLAACPGMEPAWQKHLEFWDNEPARGDYNDARVVAQYLVDCYERGDLSEFPAAFAVLERCLVEGDEAARELAVAGIIEGIQNITSHRPFGADVFCQWLGPKSRTSWDLLNQFWNAVTRAKRADL